MMERSGTCHEPDGLAELLRQEAARERPVFSEVLHGRMLRRLRLRPEAPAMIRFAGPQPCRAVWSAWRTLGSVAAGAALLAALIAVVGPRSDRAETRPRSVAVAPTGASVGDPAEAEVLGIDQVPMFDELDAGVRAGVSTLAATLLDVPEWRTIADFDAAGFLGLEGGR